jgi:hypothetical protein
MGDPRYYWLAERAWLTSNEDFFALAPQVLRGGLWTRVGADPTRHPGNEWTPTGALSWLEGPFQASDLEELHLDPVDAEIAMHPGGQGVRYDVLDAQALRDSALPINIRRGLFYFSDVTYLKNASPLLKSDLPNKLENRSGHRVYSFPSLRCQRWVGLPIHHQLDEMPEDSKLCYVQDGVLLDLIPVDIGWAGTMVILAVPELAVDASILKPVVNREVEQHLAWAKAQEAELVQQVGPILENDSDWARLRLPSSLRQGWLGG